MDITSITESSTSIAREFFTFERSRFRVYNETNDDIILKNYPIRGVLISTSSENAGGLKGGRGMSDNLHITTPETLIEITNTTTNKKFFFIFNVRRYKGFTFDDRYH